MKDLEDASAQTLREMDGGGRTLLHLCVECPTSTSVAVAAALLAHSACVNTRDAFGQGSLELAVSAACKHNCEGPAVAAVRMLLAARADPDRLAHSSQELELCRAARTPAGHSSLASHAFNGKSRHPLKGKQGISKCFKSVLGFVYPSPQKHIQSLSKLIKVGKWSGSDS